MTAAITAAGVAVVGGAIIANQQRQAAKGAANAMQSATEKGIGVEQERLAEERRQFDQQMLEYRRKQRQFEQQQAQVQTMLAPYMQGGQGALYEMLALTGIAAPQGAIPAQQQPQGLRGAPITVGGQAPSAPTTPGRMGILSAGQGAGAATRGADFYSQAQAEFNKGGRSLSSKAWQTTTADASPRAAAAYALQKAREQNPNLSAGEQQAIAQQDLQAMSDQEYINQSMMPTIEAQVNPYAGMTGAQAQQTALDRIANSPLLMELTRQGEQGILQNAAATGGLRGGNVQGALAQYRPAMLQAEIDRQYNRLAGISGAGQTSILSTPMQNPGGMPSYSGTSMLPQLYNQMGQTNAALGLANAQNQANMIGNITSAIGTGLGALANRPQTQPQSTYMEI